MLLANCMKPGWVRFRTSACASHRLLEASSVYVGLTWLLNGLDDVRAEQRWFYLEGN